METTTHVCHSIASVPDLHAIYIPYFQFSFRAINWSVSQPSFSKLWLPQWGQILFWRACWLTTWLDKSACIWMFRRSFLLSVWAITLASHQETVSTVHHYWSSLTYLWLILSSQGVNLLGISVSQTFISWLNWSTVKKTVRVKDKKSLLPDKVNSSFSAPVYNLCSYGLPRHPEKPWPLPASSIKGIKYVAELSVSSIKHDVRSAEFSDETRALQVQSTESLLYYSFIYHTYLGFHMYA